MVQSLKLPTAEQRQRDADRGVCIRLRLAISHALDRRGVTTPDAIGKAMGLDPQIALRVLTREMWDPDDAAVLQAAAARMGVRVPDRSNF